MRAPSLWPQLVKAALIGTHRQSSSLAPSFASSQAPPALDPSPKPTPPNASADPAHTHLEYLLTQLDWTEPETAVLDAAGAIALHTEAGHHPPLPRSPLLPCSPTSPLPLCSPQTAKHLRHGLSHDAEFCAEVLAWLMTYQHRIPDEYLPSLLDFGVRYPEWRSLIIPVIGKRGKWLARQNPAWDYSQWDWSLLPQDSSASPLANRPTIEDKADKGESDKDAVNKGEDRDGVEDLPEPFFEIWTTGSNDQRLDLLQRWRAIAPNAARRFLQTHWPQESAKNRAALLSTLSTGLQLADESFLDHALSDRSSTVRSIAAQLIARLPDSQWCQRMTEWGRSLFTIHPPTNPPTPTVGIASSASQAAPLQIQVTLPDPTNDPATVSPSASKQSISKSKASAKSNRKSSKHEASRNTPPADAIATLIQIVGSMSLAFWDQYGSPAMLLQAMHPQQHGSAVIQGWALAAVRQSSPPWASALLQSPKIENDLIRNNLNSQTQESSIITGLFQVLPHYQREEILAEWVPKSTQQQTSLLSSPYFANTSYQVAVEQGAVHGEAMVKWLQLAVEIQPQQWSLEFSHLVLLQLQREISHQIQSYIRELRPLARAIASRLDPSLSDSPIFAALAERTIPGPSYLERSWDQSIDIIRSTLALRQAMQATFAQPTAFT